MAPRVARQLLRFGGRGCVYARMDGGSGPGDRARTEPPLLTALGPLLSWGNPSHALPDDPMPLGPLR